MRNPFKLSASQRVVSDEDFVKLFGSGVLEMLESVPGPWDGLAFLRSAPGGGKTTLLRLLTPRPLILTKKLADSHPSVKNTYEGLRAAGVYDEESQALLGAMVVFTTEYRDLEAYDRGNSLFRELLNSRIVVATLRAVLERAERAYPDDLDIINIEWDSDSSSTIPQKATGKELFEWASRIERDFYNRMDDLGRPGKMAGGHPRLEGIR